MLDATAKQLLWLRCLGLAVPDDASAEEVSARLDRAKEVKIHSRAPNDLQLRLAMEHLWPIQDGQSRGTVAGQLYRLLKALACVYSVCRSETESDAWSYRKIAVPRRTALDVAYQVLADFDRYEDELCPAPESPDLFYWLFPEGGTRRLYKKIKAELTAADWGAKK